MYILGLATMGESAAALFKDGVLVAAVEEERFTRVKHEGCFPLRSIAYCLNSAGISLAEVHHVGVYWQPWRVWTRAGSVLSSAFRSPSAFRTKARRVLQEFSTAGEGTRKASEGSWAELFRVRRILSRHFGSFSGTVRWFDHHLCHAASAFYVSPFDKAAILILDGGGEDVSTTLAVGEGNTIRVLRSIKWPHSLGHFYSAMTGFLGFRMLDGEYKMMGLAPYATPDYLDFLRKHVLQSNGESAFRLNRDVLDYHEALSGSFSPSLVNALGAPRESESAEFTDRHAAVASSAQAAFEDVVMDLARWLAKKTGAKHAVIAGGCGLNCTANGRMLREGVFERLYIPPAPHDAGAAIGAALMVSHSELGRPREWQMTHAYFGPEWTDQDITSALARQQVPDVPALGGDELVRRTAGALAEGRIVAWFQGRMEFGPRALGSRSILADPRSDAIRETINAKIKKRELFRPFAPSVAVEWAGEYFDIVQESPFMNIAVKARPRAKTAIPAVVHVDGSCRIQTVTKEANQRYWSLLNEFNRVAGVPVLLNTSFNIQEPIVCTPDEAVSTFMRSGMDVLVIGDRFIERRVA